MTLAPAVGRAVKRARRRRLTGFAITSLAPVLLIAGAVLAVPASNPAGALVCNGYSQLCDRPYDKVVYADSHNSMANSEDRFLGPTQDPSFVHQLDNGVRALLIDTHYWTPASKVTSFCSRSQPPPERSSPRSPSQ